VKAELLRGIV